MASMAFGGVTLIGLTQRGTLFGARLLGLHSVVNESLVDYRATVNEVLMPIELVGLCGGSIMHLSDLHLEGIPDSCSRLCEALSSISADVCVITGDFIDP